MRRASAPAQNALPDLPGLIVQALGRPVAADERLAIATSGGPDSLALLGLAAAAFPGRVTALTVDHGLRPAAAAEAASVAAQCAARGLPHVVLRRQGAEIASNIQAQARDARYDLLARWCADHGHGLLLTAHHADDQAETLLMRLARGSGSAGLAGIRACRPLAPGVLLLRPLLPLRKGQLVEIAAQQGWQAVDDPSNASPQFDRTQARALIAATPWLDVPAIADAAAHLAAEARALDWAADLAWAGRVTPHGDGLALDVAGLPAALVQRLLARAIASLSGTSPRGGDVARLAARLAAGQMGTLAGIKARPGPIWRLDAAPPHRSGHRIG